MILYQTENLGKSYEYRTNTHRNWVMAPHLHEFSELAFTLEGIMTVWVDGVRYSVPQGHLVLILPNQIHEYTDQTDSRLQCAVFSNDHVPAFFQALRDRQPVSPVLDLTQHTELLWELKHVDPHNTLHLCALLNLLCEQAMLQWQLVPKRRPPSTPFYEVIEYISRNFTQEITLKQLAKRLGYHEKYLSSALHRMTGMNFRLFLASYRIQYAKDQLRAEEGERKSVAQIALDCGFSSINNFNRVFKELTGITPSEYRNGATKRG